MQIELSEPLPAVPASFVAALTTGRPELLKAVSPFDAFTLAETQQTVNLVRVLLETLVQLRQEHDGLRTLLGELRPKLNTAIKDITGVGAELNALTLPEEY